MAQQPSREFASTDPTTRTQDAGFKSVGSAQDFFPFMRQPAIRSTFNAKDATNFSSLGHEHVACGHCCSMSAIVSEIIRVHRSTT
jgi:hypothetical protein